MALKNRVFSATVMHKRLAPRDNRFKYGVYYVVIPIGELAGRYKREGLSVNCSGIISIRERDYGPRDGSSLEKWIRDLLNKHKVNDLVKDIVLVTMPRIFGYSFNPVSFWLCLDSEAGIRAVLCEVNNTFGESHSYLCLHSDLRCLKKEDWITAEKVFHVSPFLERSGKYRFRFSLSDDTLGVWIDFCDENNETRLITSLTGQLQSLSKASLALLAWQYPVVGLRVTFLIHWQALKLFLKGIKYIDKPRQKKERISTPVR